MVKKPKMTVNTVGFFDWLLGGEPKQRLPRRKRKELARLEQERRRVERDTRHRVEFLDYLGWLLKQPAKRSKY